MTGYVYDADGNRVAKGPITSWSCDPTTNGFESSGNETNYLLNQSGQIVTETTLDGNGNAQWVYTNVYANGSLFATYNAQGLHFLLNDWLGTRRASVNASGAVESFCASLPYGDDLICSGALDTPNEQHFTGKTHDQESGNDYFGARYYGSSMARFLSPDDSDGGDSDPSNPQSWNLYSYVQNSPLTNTDPNGHDCVTQTRTSDTTESLSVSRGNCSGNVGDGQTQTYVPGTVTGISVNGGNSIDIGYNSYDGQSSGVTNVGAALIPDNPGLAYGWGNNAQGYQMLGAANNVVHYATAGAIALYGGAALAPQIAAGVSALIATGRSLYYAAAGILPAVPSAVEKLQRLGISLSKANELLENPSMQRFVDNANDRNVNYFLDTGSKIVRITTDPTGRRIISAGIVQARNIANGIATGRFTK